MIKLYVKTGCPFCSKVTGALDAYQIPYEERNVSDPQISDELLSLGGKKQTPFMVDGDTMMYESQSIISYVEGKYRQDPNGVKKPKIHFARGTDVCPS